MLFWDVQKQPYQTRASKFIATLVRWYIHDFSHFENGMDNPVNKNQSSDQSLLAMSVIFCHQQGKIQLTLLTFMS